MWLAGISRPLTSASRRSAKGGVKKQILAIRREDNSVWERRAPLGPGQVQKLVRSGVKVLVQPSNRRAYPMQTYLAAGGIIEEDLSEADLIMGVKQVPIDLLEPEKTYVFFSHTIKAQETNMPMLDAILEKHIRLIDYEKMTDSKGQRVVAFGQYAGVAGMLNILHGLGLRLLALGHHTPFMHIGPAHNYRNTEMAKAALRDCGYEIALGLMPKSIGPLTFVFTGSGNVSQGAQEIFQQLPVEYVEPEHLSKVARHGMTNKVYGTVVSREDHLKHKDGKKFNPEEYEEHPESYFSTFSSKIAPYASCIINGIYWAPNSPRLISLPEAKTLLRPQRTPWLPAVPGCPNLPHRLLAICDISADPGGSIEFMQECTTIDSPFCLYDADQNMNKESFAGDGVLICSIDNMPAQIPREATDFFGGLLMPYIQELLNSDAKQPFEDFEASPVVKNAVIASNGKLTPNFQYISELRRTSGFRNLHKTSGSTSDTEKKVLILGAGYVSAPVLDYLSRDENVNITVAAQLKSDIDSLSSRFNCITPVLLEIHRSQGDLEKLIKNHDIVVSLLPYQLHPDVAKLCIQHKTDMVTASYKSPAMKALHQAAVDANITIMNEVGVDPGIDHLLAMQCFEDIREHGGKVTSFVSWCGGIPAPECSDNPLRYKFSWSPRGVLYNVLSGAKYLQDGKVVDIQPNGALLDAVQDMSFLPGFNLEGYPNRDSTIYAQEYHIESATTILRGTLRYKGFVEATKALVKMGLVDPNPHPLLHHAGPDITWKAFLSEVVGQKTDLLLDSIKGILYEHLNKSETGINCLEQLGLLDDECIDKKESPLDTLSNYLSKKLAYGPGERDLIVMRHDIGVQWLDQTQETRHVDLVVYGDPKKYTAMAATVGFPTAIATKMVLDGEIQTKGMVLPFTPNIYRPMLNRLAQEGIVAREHTTTIR